jgi:hypothetical protein
MTLSAPMEEILTYLSGQTGYAIFAGLAARIHVGTPCSPDVDVFFDTLERVDQVIRDMADRGWSAAKSMGEEEVWTVSTLEKGGTSFDICWSQNASDVLIPEAVSIEFSSYVLSVVSLEALFLTKLLQLSLPNRSPGKTARDRATIEGLRSRIRPDQLRRLASSLRDEVWQRGMF